MTSGQAAIPVDPAIDSTGPFFKEGYNFIGNRCRSFGSDIFRTRIMLRGVTCIAGEEAARRFYDGRHFTRVGAMPQMTLRLLQDKGSVQLLDGAAHQARKAMFLEMMAPEAGAAMGVAVERRWQELFKANRRETQINLHDAVQAILCAAACDWAGIPLSAAERPKRTREFAAMIDGAGSMGPRNWKGLLLRRRTERWARGIVDRLRNGGLAELPDSPATRIASFRDKQGGLLDRRTAGVEILNLVRPTVAVARFVVFAALALHEHPAWRERLRWSGTAEALSFVQEVRRFYPFFPVIGGRVREPFEWRSHPFRTGDWVLLGLHATNHDPRLWPEPERFEPDRFSGWKGSGYDLVPQGAGEHARDHRCPGEWLTIEIMLCATRLLAGMEYEVPEQDLTVPLDRFPTLPRSGFVVENVRMAATLVE